MKTSVNRILCAVLCFLWCTTFVAQEKNQIVKKLTGVWNYTAPTAPQGYEKGVITFVSAENKTIGKALIQGSEYKTAEIKLQEEDTYVTSMNVDGYQVELILKWLPEGIKAYAVTQGMEIPVTLSEVKK